MIIKFLTSLVLLLVFSVNTYGANIDDYYENSLEASGAKELADYLSDETEDYLDRLGCGDMDFEKILDMSPKSVFELLKGIVADGYKQPLKAALTATGIVLLVSVCSCFFPDDEKSRAVVNIICGCTVALGIFVPATESVRSAVTAIGACAGFEKALIPVLAAVLTAGGKPVVALSFKGAAFAAAEFVQSFAKNFALPLTGISASLSVTGAMLPTLRLNAVSDMLRKTMVSALACAAGLFTGFLSLKSILASSADALTVKGVRMAASFVPVVGGALGEAYSSVAASISLLKSTVGIYAIIALALICLPVVINLFLWVLAMRAAYTVSDLLDCRICSEILKGISFVFSTVNSILLLCAAVFIISTGLVITLGGG